MTVVPHNGVEVEMGKWLGPDARIGYLMLGSYILT